MRGNKIFGKLVAGVLIGVVLCGLLVICIGYFMVDSRIYTVPWISVTVEQASASPGNSIQWDSATKLVACNGRLYYHFTSVPLNKLNPIIYLHRHNMYANSGKLCKIDQGEIIPLIDIQVLLGSCGDYIYCLKNEQLIAYDVTSAEEIVIKQLDNLHYGYIWTDDNTLQILLDEQTNEILTVKDCKVIRQAVEETPFGAYQLGDNWYAVSGDASLLCNGKDISKQVGHAKQRTLLPYKDGLLLVNSGGEKLLFFIDASGSIKQIFFDIPCHSSKSCVNFYGDYVFVSFTRYQGYGPSNVTLELFENDTLPGTYRIDTRDNTITKISDTVYGGMYIFDDTGIFTVGKDFKYSIVKIGFNGDRIVPVIY